MRSHSLRELGYLAGQALMELLPVWMLCAVVQAGSGRPLPWTFTQCLGLQLTASVSAWCVRRFQLQRAQQVLSLVAVGAVLIWSWLALAIQVDSLKPTDTSFGSAGTVSSWSMAVYLCARGFLTGLSTVSGTVLRWFGVGIGATVLLFAFLALAGVSPAEQPFSQLRALCVAHLVMGGTLTGLAQRRGRLARSSALSGASGSPLFVVLIPVAGILVLAMLPVLGLQGTSRLVRTGFSGLQSIVHELLVVVHWVGVALADAARWLGSLWSAGQGAPRAPHATDGSGEDWLPLARPNDASSFVRSEYILSLLVLMLGLGVAALFLLGLARRRTALRTGQGFEEHEEASSTLSWQLLLEPLARLRKAYWRRSGQPTVSSPVDPNSLRAVYRALLVWAATQNERRAASTTAQEFARQLADRFVGKRRSIMQLTDYYMHERYAERTCSPAETAHARALLDEVTTSTRQT